MVRLGVLGGTFNPVHRGHLHLAHRAYTYLNLDSLLFVPAGDPPHKQGQAISPAEHRLAMLALALEDRPQFSLSRVDIDRPGPHYSLDMIRLLRQAYQVNASQCYFIIGADSLVDLPTWHQPARLLEQCRLAVFRRPGYTADLQHLTQLYPLLESRLVWIDMPPEPISATQIRQKCRQGQSIADEVPPKVARYIQDNQLYAC